MRTVLSWRRRGRPLIGAVDACSPSAIAWVDGSMPTSQPSSVATTSTPSATTGEPRIGALIEVRQTRCWLPSLSVDGVERCRRSRRSRRGCRRSSGGSRPSCRPRRTTSAAVATSTACSRLPKPPTQTVAPLTPASTRERVAGGEAPDLLRRSSGRWRRGCRRARRRRRCRRSARARSRSRRRSRRARGSSTLASLFSIRRPGQLVLST